MFPLVLRIFSITVRADFLTNTEISKTLKEYQFREKSGLLSKALQKVKNVDFLDILLKQFIVKKFQCIFCSISQKV